MYRLFECENMLVNSALISDIRVFLQKIVPSKDMPQIH